MNTITVNDAHDLGFSRGQDRRRAPRSKLAYKVVKIRRGSDEGLARCRNISDTGMNVEVSLPLGLMERVQVEIGPDSIISGRVAWTNGDECGLAFDRSVDCAALLSLSVGKNRLGRARGPRLDSDIPARVLLDDGEQRATTISNISQQGMRVSHDGDFRPGLSVKVLLPDGREKAAIVQWTDDNCAGLLLFDHFSLIDLGDLRSVGHRELRG